MADPCSDNVKYPTPIKPGVKFDIADVDCTYYRSGVFNSEQLSSECSDPFMQEAQRHLPSCEESCCEADTPGSW